MRRVRLLRPPHDDPYSGAHTFIPGVVINRDYEVCADDTTPCAVCQRATPADAILCDNIHCGGRWVSGFFCGPACAQVSHTGGCPDSKCCPPAMTGSYWGSWLWGVLGFLGGSRVHGSGEVLGFLGGSRVHGSGGS